MSLSEFIGANCERILDAWTDFAREVAPGRQLNMAALREHAAGILKAIAADLEQPQTEAQADAKSRGKGPRPTWETDAEKHGAARVLEGFSINDVMAEFRALRASVLSLWNASTGAGAPVVAELTRFNEAVDQAMCESLARFASDKECATRLFDTLLSASPDLSYILDLDGKLLYGNKALSALYGRPAAQIVGLELGQLYAPLAGELAQHLRQVIDSGTTYRGELPYTKHPGHLQTYEYLLVPVFDDAGKVEAVAGTARDVTERKAIEEQVRRSAQYDSLTDLPNRMLFLDRLEHDMKRSARTGLPVALMFIDLDGFKDVNDWLGHDAGDQLLRECARRIVSRVRDTDTVARLGGDEFTVILSEVRDIPHTEVVAAQILAELARPFMIGPRMVNISGSIGLTLYPPDAHAPQELLRNADLAMYVAKRAGRNCFRIYSPDMNVGTGRAKAR